MPFISFKGKSAVETYHHSVPHHTLEFDTAQSVLPNGDAPALDGDLIIEGDNLLALKALLPTHAGKVKCIYIDPPYNTGNEAWVYNDNLTQPQFKEWIGEVVGKEGDDACRHDKWLCMMYPRLQLLKELLRDDGAIFISIDDNEVAHLRMLMDEVFGEENFVATVIWQKMFSPKNTARLFSVDHDYVVVYARNITNWVPNREERGEEQDTRYKNPDNDPRGPWTSGDLSARNYYSLGVYPITCPSGRVIPGPPKGTYWRVSPEGFQTLDEDARIWWGKDGDNVPRLKRFLSEVQAGLVPQTIWPYSDVGHTQEAKKELVAVVAEDRSVFMTPKPTRLIRRILQLATEPGDLILDSFAGSGTTAHAVLAMNAEDGGDRRFILVQQPYDTKDNEKDELNICQNVTAERVRRVINGYSYSNGKGKQVDVEGLGGSFTYARVSEKPMLGPYKDLGDVPPAYEDLAKYVYYTETSHQWDPDAAVRETGFIGAHAGASYYLLYAPGSEDEPALDLPFLNTFAVNDPRANLVVYAEALRIHRDDLRRWEKETGKSVRTMQVPYQLR
jgi:DNA modification methylase